MKRNHLIFNPTKPIKSLRPYRFSILKKWIFILLLVQVSAAKAQTISNVKATQQGKEVQITYDINGAAADEKFTVNLFLSDGNNWQGPLKSVKGDVGQGISGTCCKKITWLVLNDYKPFKGSCSFKVTGNLEKKEKTSEPASTTTETDLESIKENAKRLFDSKEFLKAAEQYELVIFKGEKTNQDYFNLGNAYYFGKDYVKADAVYSYLLGVQPTSILANLFKARCIGLQKLDEDQSKGLAKPYYENVTLFVTQDLVSRYSRQLIEAYSYLGSYYAIRKDVSQAHAAWNKVLELDPGNDKAKLGLQIR